METNPEFFTLSGDQFIKGTCTTFVSEAEKLWRSFDKYEEAPFKAVSAHIRNVKYTSANTRTFQTLRIVLGYLFENIVPLFFKEGVTREQKVKISLFLEERILAIRCEYFVQGIICPKQILKLIKCFVVTSIFKGHSDGTSPFVGLEMLLEPEAKDQMESKFSDLYRQALVLSIFGSRKKEILKLLSNHEYILEDPELSRLAQLRIQIQRNNYHLFYQSIEKQSPLVHCLLCLRLEEERQMFGQIIKKACGAVPKEWLLKRLCIRNMSYEQWISLKQNEQILEQNILDLSLWYDLQKMRNTLV